MVQRPFYNEPPAKHTAQRAAMVCIAAVCLCLCTCLCLAGCSSTSTQNSQGDTSQSSSSQASDVTVESFEGTSVAVITGSMQQHIAEKLWDSIDIQCFDTASDTFASVSAGKAACTIQPYATYCTAKANYPNLAYVDEQVYSADIAFAFPKGSADSVLYQQLNEFVAQCREDGTLAELEDIWFSTDESRKTIPDASTLSGENGTLNLAISSGEEPYEYYKDGRIVGYNPDLAYRFCKAYGYSYTMDDLPFSSLIMAMGSDKYDFSPACFAVTEERKQSVDFSDAVTVYYNVVVYRADEQAASAASTDAGIGSSLAGSFEKTFVTEDRWQLIASGLGITLLVTICASILGTLLAFCLVLARRRGGKVANKLVDIYVRIFQGTPVLVVLLIFYYVVFGNVNLPSALVAIIVFALNSAAFISETLHTNIRAVDPGQREAALSSGFTESQAFLRFILPVAARQSVPVYRGEIINLLKGTSIVGYVALMDLTKAGDIIRSRTYEALFPLLAVALIYLLMGWIISILFKQVEKALVAKRRTRKIKGVVMR